MRVLVVVFLAAVLSGCYEMEQERGEIYRLNRFTGEVCSRLGGLSDWNCMP